jgi:haloacetate dehalogenase
MVDQQQSHVFAAQMIGGRKQIRQHFWRGRRHACAEQPHSKLPTRQDRLGAQQDLAADEADLAARRTIEAPVCVLSGSFFLTAGLRPALDVWRETFAPKAIGAQINSGHFLAEENAPDTLTALLAFL